MLPAGDEVESRVMEDERQAQRPASDGQSARSSPGYHHEDDMDELEEDEEDARSVGESSEGGGTRGEDPLTSTSGTASNSVSSTANEGSSAVPVPHKTQAAFVHKLWSMLYTPTLSRLISWSDDGKAFTVYYPTEFARTVLPQFFKHSNFASFIRQLNMYSFAKVNDALGATTSQNNPDGSQVQAWEFQNPAFQRDRPDLLARIRRKSAKTSSSTVASPATSARRRSTVARPAVMKNGSRREELSEGPSEDSEQAPRVAAAVLTAAAAMAQQPNPSVLFGDAPVAPSSSSIDRKVVAGLNEFAPQPAPFEARPNSTRAKEEPENVSIRSPSSFPRPQPPYPSPYPHPPSHGSPPSRPQAYPPQSAYYPPPRSNFSDEGYSRQISLLEGQVRSLGDALYQTQQEYMASRAMSYSILGTMLGIMSDLDASGKRKEEIEACSIALSKLHPDAPATTPTYPSPFPSSSAYPGPPPSNWHPNPFPPNGQVSPRASTSAAGYNNYYNNRIPPAESYTRSSRPDSRMQDSHPSLPPPSHPSAAPAFRSSAALQDTTRPTSPSTGPPPPSTALPMSSGLASAYPQQVYPSPRPSWQNQSVSSSRTTSLPSLSSLLEGVPASGERRGKEDGREPDHFDERARKKLRQ